MAEERRAWAWESLGRVGAPDEQHVPCFLEEGVVEAGVLLGHVLGVQHLRAVFPAGAVPQWGQSVPLRPAHCWTASRAFLAHAPPAETGGAGSSGARCVG